MRCCNARPTTAGKRCIKKVLKSNNKYLSSLDEIYLAPRFKSVRTFANAADVYFSTDQLPLLNIYNNCCFKNALKSFFFLMFTVLCCEQGILPPSCFCSCMMNLSKFRFTHMLHLHDDLSEFISKRAGVLIEPMNDRPLSAEAPAFLSFHMLQRVR